MFSVWNQTSICCALPWRRQPSQLPTYSLPVVLCKGLKPHRLFFSPSRLACLFMSYWFGSNLDSHVGDIIGVDSDVTRRLTGPLALTIFLSLFDCFP